MIPALLAALSAHAEDPAVLPLPAVRPGHPTEPAPRYGTTGFRAVVPADGHAASSRVALVQDLDGPTIGELTLRGQTAWQHVGLAVEVAGTAGASARWSGAGLGNTVVDARVLFGRSATHALGLRATLATGWRTGALGPVAWWGTVPQATVPTWGGALAYSGATTRWSWHAEVGFYLGAWWFPMPDLTAIVATAQPLAERLDLVVEVEATYAESPLHARALVRRDFMGGWEADLGVTVPIVAMFRDPSIQVVGRVERRW